MNEYVDDIARESEAFAATIRPDTVDLPVPCCTEWKLRDLVWHLGRVQEFWSTVVRAGVDEQPEFPDEVPGPSDANELAVWMRERTRNLLDALRAVPADAVAWSWWKEPHTAGAIGRHQVQEAAVHRWDAQSTVGTPDALSDDVAADGVDEFLGIARQFSDPTPVAFTATDIGQTFAMSDEPPAVTANARAADLVLLFYRRITPDAVTVEGDPALLDEFLQPIE